MARLLAQLRRMDVAVDYTTQIPAAFETTDDGRWTMDDGPPLERRRSVIRRLPSTVCRPVSLSS